MTLAMNGVIASDQMGAKALELYNSVTSPNDKNPNCRAGNANLMQQALIWEGQRVNRPLDAQLIPMPGSRDVFWSLIRAEIDSGHPVIIGTFVTSVGHVMVIVGYRQAGLKRELIAYDPYGRWKGTINSWDANAENDPASARGRWVHYDLATFPLGTYLITAHRTDLGQTNTPLAVGPTTPADLMSDEPELPMEYFGVPTFQNVMIPSLIR